MVNKVLCEFLDRPMFFAKYILRIRID